MHGGTTEERFEAAVRNLSERWKSFDFVRHVESGDANLTGYDPDRDEFVPHPAELLGPTTPSASDTEWCTRWLALMGLGACRIAVTTIKSTWT